MNEKIIRLACVSFGVLLLMGSPLLAADIAGTGSFYGAALGSGLGCALTLVGAGIGFGKIGASALESMARQPEVAGQVSASMITIAALLEGATFFSLIVCIILAFKS
jgi:F-type H+-transporting ATPase subunit c